MIWLKLAWREIRNQWRLSLFFVLNLALGLLGFTLLEGFQAALDRSLSDRSRLLLTADLSVSARRQLTDDETRIIRETLGPGYLEGRTLELLSMARGPARSRLVDLTAIDATYPFYGQLQLARGGAVTSGRGKEPILSEPQAWVEPAVETQLGVAPGGTIRIGGMDFKVADRVDADSSTAFGAFALAPQVYLGIPQLERTGLVAAKGSSVTYRRLYRLPEGSDSERLREELNRRLKDPAVFVMSHRTAREQTGRALDYLNDYLGLVALVALFLSSLGAAYLYRSFLARRLDQIAILMSLGVTQARARSIYLIQLALLGAGAAVACVGLSALLFPVLARVLAGVLPFPIAPVLSPASAQLAFWIGTLGSLLVCFPLLRRIRRLSPAGLFQEAGGVTGAADAPGAREGLATIVSLFPAFAAYWGLAVWQAHSWKVGSLFTAAFLLSAGALALLAWSGLALLARVRALGSPLRMAIRNLHRSRASSISCFLAIGLGSLLIVLIPQVREGLLRELEQPRQSELPSLFLFDIQEDQVAPLEQLLKERGSRLDNLSPLVRARLLEVNGEPFEKRSDPQGLSTREQEEEARSRNRGFNLTYRAELTEAESLVAGRPFSGRYDEAAGRPAEVSLEHRFAQRVGLKLGDRLAFDIQGVAVPAVVVSLRKVRWTSFRPNFFVTFQPGAIDEAPKTFLAAIPGAQAREADALQAAIVDRFPNISVVDVATAARKVLLMFGQMSWAIQWMAFLSLFAGLVVLYSISSHQASTRRQEISLLKVLGSDLARIRRIFQYEFGLLGATAAATGVALSMVVTYVLARVIFDGSWVPSARVPLAVVVGVAALSVATSHLATRRALARKPLALLQGE